MLFLFVLLCGSLAYGMQRPDSIEISDPYRSPFATPSSPVLSPDDDALCDLAVLKYSGSTDLVRYIKPHLAGILKESHHDASGAAASAESNIDVLRRVASGGASMIESDQRIHSMVVRAVQSTLEEKEAVVAAREARIKEKYSGKKTATIAGITGVVATIVTTICATLVTLNSKCQK